jgi:hypothetical protein
VFTFHLGDRSVEVAVYDFGVQVQKVDRVAVKRSGPIFADGKGRTAIQTGDAITACRLSGASRRGGARSKRCDPIMSI